MYKSKKILESILNKKNIEFKYNCYRYSKMIFKEGRMNINR